MIELDSRDFLVSISYNEVLEEKWHEWLILKFEGDNTVLYYFYEYNSIRGLLIYVISVVINEIAN